MTNLEKYLNRCKGCELTDVIVENILLLSEEYGQEQHALGKVEQYQRMTWGKS